MTKLKADELVNVTGIADRLGVPRTNVNGWTRSDKFPKPLDTPGLGGVRVYRWSDVAAWVDARPHVMDR